MNLLQTAATIDMLRRRARVGWAMMVFMLLASPGALSIALVRAAYGGTAWEVLGWGFMSGFGLGVVPFLFLNSAVLERNDVLIDVLLKKQSLPPRALSQHSNEELLQIAREETPP